MKTCIRSVLVLVGILAAAAAPAAAQQEIDVSKIFINAGTITSGSGAPTASEPTGSFYLRTDTGQWYIRGASSWATLIDSSGKIPAISSTHFTSLSGANLTSLNASQLSSGNVPYARMPSGSGTWSATPTISGAVTLSSTLGVTGATTLSNTLGATGVATFSNDIDPSANYVSNLGDTTKRYLTIHAGELNVQTLVAQGVMATLGGRILVAPTTVLTADLASGGTSMTVRDNHLANGDRVVMEGGGQVEWLAVTSGAGGSAGAYTYSITRNLDGSGANNWLKGDAIVNTGTTGDGYMDLYASSGLLPGTTVGPTIVGNIRTGTTYSNIEPRWALGNLNGLFGYSTDTYGAAFGQPDAAWVKIDGTNGVRIGHDTDTVIALTAAGAASFEAGITIGSAGSVTAGGVVLDADGLYIDPIAASGGGGYADTNAVRWTTGDTLHRTAIWRSDDSSGSATKYWQLDHINSYVATVNTSTQINARQYHIGSTTNYMEAVTHLTAGGNTSEWRAHALNTLSTTTNYPLISMRGGSDPSDQRIFLGTGALSSTWGGTPSLNTGFSIIASTDSISVNGRIDGDSAIRERGRSVAIGDWTSVAHSGGNFTTDTGTWTVESGDQTTFSYTMVGETMFVTVDISSSTIASSPTELRVTLPAGLTATQRQRVSAQALNNGTVHSTAFAQAQASSTVIRIYRDVNGTAWDNGTNNNFVSFTLPVKVQ